MLNPPTSRIAGFDARPVHPFWTEAARASRRRAAAVLVAAICLDLFAAGAAFAADTAASAPAAGIEAPATASTGLADFRAAAPSSDARRVADWVMRSGDNRGMPFVIVDKKGAEVFVFDRRGTLSGATPALLGLARGDDSSPGIGDRRLSAIRPDERTTPAGRFVASLGEDLASQGILWVDYAAALALHRVRAADTPERRLERLAAPSAPGRRITFGCINVPAGFYDRIVRPAFTGTSGVVYILPEVKSLPEVFPSFAS